MSYDQTPVTMHQLSPKHHPKVSVSTTATSQSDPPPHRPSAARLDPELAPPPTQQPPQPLISGQDPFGTESGNGVQYKTLHWWQCSFLMIAETISLGILSLPSVIASMGFVPGVLLILAFGVMSTYTGVICGQFKATYPGTHSFSDAAGMLCGRTGEWVVDVAQALVFIFIMSAHILAFSIMMNVLTEHSTCSVTFAAVGTLLSLILTFPRTWKNVSWASAVSCASITAAVMITMVAVGIRRPDALSALTIVPSTPFSAQAYSLGVSNIVIAFTGHTAYFSFISELRKPADFRKSLALLQVTCISFYVVVAVVIYRYAGAEVASPALGSASHVMRKVAYGVAAPTIVVAGVVNAHVCVKNVYVKIFRGTNVVHERTFKSIGSWLGMCTVVWVVAFVLSNSIPVFNNLLGLMGALLCSWFSLGIPAMLWLYMNKEKRLSALTMVNIFIILVSLVVCVMGAWGSGKSIAEGNATHRPWSCDDNS